MFLTLLSNFFNNVNNYAVCILKQFAFIFEKNFQCMRVTSLEEKVKYLLYNKKMYLCMLHIIRIKAKKSLSHV